MKGVLSTRVGFTGGHTPQPTYQRVCTKTTGHAEAVEVRFDPMVVSFEALAMAFFEMHDPTINRKDKGGQYRSAIFYTNEKQREVALALIEQLQEKGYEVVTEIEAASTFWPADERHQGYCETRDITPKSYFQTRF